MAELRSLTEIFNNTLFRIPDYQRGYAWGETQILDFWNDLVNLVDKHNHYTGMLSLKEIDKTPVGTFVTRVTNDTNALSDLFTNVIVNLITQITTLIYAIIFIFMLNWRLSLIIFTLMPIIVISTIMFRYYSRRVFRKITYNHSRINSFLSENLSGMKITQIFYCCHRVYSSCCNRF